MLGLHEGLFAGPALRAPYVFSGLRLVEGLNVATIIDLPVAITAYFWANRLLPLAMADRAAWKVNGLFLVWLGLFLHATLRPAANVRPEQSWLAALSFALLPLVNALTTFSHLGHSLPQGDWVMAGFDLSMLALG